MEQNGLAPKGLIPYLGSRNRVYEVINPQATAESEDDLACTKAWAFRRIPHQDRRWRIRPETVGRGRDASSVMTMTSVSPTSGPWRTREG